MNIDIIFKLSAHMYHWIVNMRLQAILECFVDDVIRSQNKSKLWTTIALSKFQLKKRSTAQNVTNWTGYQKFKFQFHIQISKFWQVRNLELPFHHYLFFNSNSTVFGIPHGISEYKQRYRQNCPYGCIKSHVLSIKLRIGAYTCSRRPIYMNGSSYSSANIGV